jgi:hypothetical protein
VPGERVITQEASLAETVELVGRELEGVPPATRIVG